MCGVKLFHFLCVKLIISFDNQHFERTSFLSDLRYIQSERPYLKSKQQNNVFSFPYCDLNENEDVKMSSRTSSSDFFSTSSSMQSSPLLAPEESINHTNRKPFNASVPPPSGPPPPPPDNPPPIPALPAHLQSKSSSNIIHHSSSQISLNSLNTPSPPVYPPPTSELKGVENAVLSRKPPPIPTRPKTTLPAHLRKLKSDT